MSSEGTERLAGPEQDRGEWPVGTDSFWQPHRAAFWLLAAMIVNGLFYTVNMFSMGFRVVPVTALLGLLVWGIYTLLFLLVFRTLDLLEQHPPEAFVLAFAWGGMGAVYFAAPANIAIQGLCAKLVSPDFVAAWGPAIAGPITEEFLKLAGVILLVLVARNQFQTYLSVLIVGAMAGLGFQVVENLSYTVNASMHFPLENQVYPVLLNLFTRGLLSGLWSHAAYTTIASFGVAWFLLHPERSKADADRRGLPVLRARVGHALHLELAVAGRPLRRRLPRDGRDARGEGHPRDDRGGALLARCRARERRVPPCARGVFRARTRADPRRRMDAPGRTAAALQGAPRDGLDLRPAGQAAEDATAARAATAGSQGDDVRARCADAAA
jgi:RsiW-degrading membrane proteinase PrsW (M82 family)